MAVIGPASHTSLADHLACAAHDGTGETCQLSGAPDLKSFAVYAPTSAQLDPGGTVISGNVGESFCGDGRSIGDYHCYRWHWVSWR